MHTHTLRKSSKHALSHLLFCLVFLVGSASWGWGQVSGKAVVFLGESLRHRKFSVRTGETLTLPVQVDLSRVSRTKGGIPVEAALGGYVINIEFDKRVVSLGDVQGGEAVGFEGSPTLGIKEKGMKVTATLAWSQAASPIEPTGMITVAHVSFQAIGQKRRSTRLKVEVKNLSLSFNAEAEPQIALIPARGLSSQIRIRRAAREGRRLDLKRR